jgi:cell wall-associated NlpC family hydrolase
MSGNEALNRAARKIIGTGYTPHGRTPEEGMDCYGVAIYLLRAINITVPDVFYPDTDDETSRRLLQTMKASIPNMELEKPEPGCVIEFNIFGEPSHIGVYLGIDGGLFIHASKNHGVCAEPLSKWRHLATGFYRVVNA